MKYLSKKHKIYLAFLIDDKKDLPYVDELKKYCETIDYDFISPGWQKIKSLPYLLSRKPFTVPYFYSKKLQKVVDYRLSTIKFDAIFAFSSPMAEYVLKSKVFVFRSRFDRSKRINDPMLIIDFVDVDSDKWRMYAGFSSFPKSWVYKREWKQLMKYEKKIGKLFDVTIFVSEKEMELFKSFCPDSHAVSVPNGVDFEYFKNVFNISTKKAIQRQPNTSNILFLGAMDYFPNEDAVLYFFNEIWPHIKKQLVQVKFYVVGRRPSKKVKILSKNDEDIVVTGHVHDVRPYLRKADVFVAPLRISRGIQNKVLEAMAAGVPVVARPEAMQGISGYNGCVRVEKNNLRFALSVLDLIKIPHKRQAASEASIKFVMHKYDWENNLKEFEKIFS